MTTDPYNPDGIRISPRARLSWIAHLFKACLRQHHRELVPLLSPLIPRDGVVLDAGGHAGQFTKLFARMARSGRVYTVEPGSYALSILRPAIRWNRLGNVTILPVALGDAEARADLSMPVKHSGSYGFGLSHLGAGDTGGVHAVTEPVHVTTVDAIAAEYAWDRLDFIKADIEGWELRMLYGAAETLTRFHPALMIEVYADHLARAGDTPAALFDYLGGVGYRPFRFNEKRTELVAIEAAAEGNIVFVAE